MILSGCVTQHQPSIGDSRKSLIARIRSSIGKSKPHLIYLYIKRIGQDYPTDQRANKQTIYQIRSQRYTGCTSTGSLSSYLSHQLLRMQNTFSKSTHHAALPSPPLTKHQFTANGRSTPEPLGIPLCRATQSERQPKRNACRPLSRTPSR